MSIVIVYCYLIYIIIKIYMVALIEK